MRTAVAATSIAAYHSIPDRDKSDRLVLAAMEEGRVYSNKQIAAQIKREAGWVSARRNALMALGLIEERGTVVCPVTGRTVNGYALAPAQMALELTQ